MCTELEIRNISDYSSQVLDLNNARLDDEYFYQSLPLCVIDSVYSIRARWEGVRQVVIRYCNYFNLQRIRENRTLIPPIESQESIGAFLQKIQEFGIETFTNDIFQNRQRTSTRNGLLKSEAVLRFASVLEEHGVNYLQNVSDVIDTIAFENEIRQIPGQRSGITLKYFFMLSGSDNLIKPDTMILGFLSNILERPVTPEEAQICLTEAANRLILTYPHLTPRLLDQTIWRYRRAL
jgi:hypothetical protein